MVKTVERFKGDADMFQVMRDSIYLFLVLGAAMFLESCAPVVASNPVEISISSRELTTSEYQVMSTDPVDPKNVCLMINATGFGVLPQISSRDSGTCSNPFPGIGIPSGFMDLAVSSTQEVSMTLPIGDKRFDLVGFPKSMFEGGVCPDPTKVIRFEETAGATYVRAGDQIVAKISDADESVKPVLFAKAKYNVMGGENVDPVRLQVLKSGTEWIYSDYGCEGGDEPQLVFASNSEFDQIGANIFRTVAIPTMDLSPDLNLSKFDSCPTASLNVVNEFGTSMSDVQLDPVTCELSLDSFATTTTSLASKFYRLIEMTVKRGTREKRIELAILQGTPNLPVLYVSRYHIGGGIVQKPMSTDIRKQFYTLPLVPVLTLEITNAGSSKGTGSWPLDILPNIGGSPLAYNGFQYADASNANRGSFPGGTTVPTEFSGIPYCHPDGSLASATRCIVRLKLQNITGERSLSFKPFCTNNCAQVPELRFSYEITSGAVPVGTLIAEKFDGSGSQGVFEFDSEVVGLFHRMWGFSYTGSASNFTLDFPKLLRIRNVTQGISEHLYSADLNNANPYATGLGIGFAATGPTDRCKPLSSGNPGTDVLVGPLSYCDMEFIDLSAISPYQRTFKIPYKYKTQGGTDLGYSALKIYVGIK